MEPYPYETQETDLGDIPQANPSSKDLKRDAREQTLLNKVWKRKEGPANTPVLAVADGTMVVAKDRFFPGNAVFIDHGDGLIRMSFHLSEIKVKAGEQIKKGDTVGLVGTTGRSTGPHLFFGVRGHNARINPQFHFEDRPRSRPWVPE